MPEHRSVSLTLVDDGREEWHPRSWRGLPTGQQQPPETDSLREVQRLLAAMPVLVDGPDTDQLVDELVRVHSGQAFLLQVGDCVENFAEPASAAVPRLLRLVTVLAEVLHGQLKTDVVPVVRAAGQYAKPRSRTVEHDDGLELPVFRGEMINAPELDPLARTPDPIRMVGAFCRSLETVHLLRLHGIGSRAPNWLRHPRRLVDPDGDGELSRSVELTERELSPTDDPLPVWISHECLLLPYEEALTRRTGDGRWLLGSTHLPWIGDRTRQPDGAHVYFAGGLTNPVAVKAGPAASPAELRTVVERLGGGVVPVTVVTRLGSDLVADRLPELVAAVAEAGPPVNWVCDPMHGNTRLTARSSKIRYLPNMVSELVGTVQVLADCGQRLAGVHLEATAEDAQECADLDEELDPADYRSLCDPRLNLPQAVRLLADPRLRG